jgi:hypothetical protein
VEPALPGILWRSTQRGWSVTWPRRLSPIPSRPLVAGSRPVKTISFSFMPGRSPLMQDKQAVPSGPYPSFTSVSVRAVPESCREEALSYPKSAMRVRSPAISKVINRSRLLALPQPRIRGMTRTCRGSIFIRAKPGFLTSVLV